MIINRRLSKKHQNLVRSNGFLNSQNYVLGNYQREKIYSNYYHGYMPNKLREWMITISILMGIMLFTIYTEGWVYLVLIGIPVGYVLLCVFNFFANCWENYKNKKGEQLQVQKITTVFGKKREKMYNFFGEYYIFKKKVGKSSISKNDFLIFKK